MTSDRKKPTAGFWITVALVAALVGYPLSIGPACSALDMLGNPDGPRDVYQVFYAPILWLYSDGPQPVHDAIKWYCDLFP